MNLQEKPTAVNDTTSPPAQVSLTFALIGSAIVAALGGFLFGFDTAVISGTTEALKTTYGLNAFSVGFTVAIALMGTIIGSIIAGKPADVWGRRRVLMVLAVLYFVWALGSALAWDWFAFLAFRLLGGVAVGGASVVSPLYIAEIAPARVRGRLVAVQQFNIVLGMLAAFLSNYLIAQTNLGAEEWRWMLGVQVVPSAFFFLLLFLTPESPRWLMAQRPRRRGAGGPLDDRSRRPGDRREIQEIAARSTGAPHAQGEPSSSQSTASPSSWPWPLPCSTSSRASMRCSTMHPRSSRWRAGRSGALASGGRGRHELVSSRCWR